MKTLISDADHQRVLATAIDVPEENPAFAVPLSEVGITGKTVWVDFQDRELGRLPFTAEILVNLGAQSRGIHMSRIEQSVTGLQSRKFSDLSEYALVLGREVLVRQKATRGSVTLSGAIPYLTRTGVSDQVSHDTLTISARAELIGQDHEGSRLTTGAGIHHLTACPCTQVYNQSLFNQAAPPCPLPTHTQRSKTILKVESPAHEPNRPSHTDLVLCLNEALHSVQDLLKRPDEAELVLKAHLKPQFAEDVVREVAQAVGTRFGRVLPPETVISIESLSQESIHIHDVACRLRISLREICEQLYKN